jgi:DDE domain
MITDKLASYRAAKREVMRGIEHRQHKGLNNRAENSHQPTRRRERQMKQFKSAGTAVPLSSRSDQQPVPSPPRSRHCRRAQSLQDADIPSLGRNLRLYRYDLNRNFTPPSRLVTRAPNKLTVPYCLRSSPSIRAFSHRCTSGFLRSPQEMRG